MLPLGPKKTHFTIGALTGLYVLRFVRPLGVFMRLTRGLTCLTHAVIEGTMADEGCVCVVASQDEGQ